MQQITNGPSGDIVFCENNEKQPIKYKDIVDNRINGKLWIDSSAFLNAFFTGRVVTSLLTSFLPFRDILSLREAVLGTPRGGVVRNADSLPFYKRIAFASEKSNIHAEGFVYERKCDMLHEINRIVKVKGPQQEEISKLVKESSRLGKKGFKEKIQLRIFEYLLSLDDTQMQAISLDDNPSNYFIFKKDLSDVLKIREFCRGEKGAFDAKDVNPQLLLAASHDLYVQEKFSQQLEIIQILNKELVDKKNALLDPLDLPQEETTEHELILQKVAQNDVQAVLEFMKSPDCSAEIRGGCCSIFLKTKRFDLAEEIVKTITDNDSRKYWTCIGWILRDEFEQALELALIIDEEFTEIWRMDVCKNFVAAGALKEALELALTTSGDFSAFDRTNLCETLIAAGALKGALELALTINGGLEALHKEVVCKNFVAAGALKEALELALTIDRDYITFGKVDVCKTLIAVGALKKALELALTIEGDSAEVYKKDVCRAFIEAGALKEALELALTIEGNSAGSCRGDVCRAFIAAGALKEALELALTIPMHAKVEIILFLMVIAGLWILWEDSKKTIS